MDDPNNTIGALEVGEDFLSYAVADEALEAAADREKPSSDYCVYSGSTAFVLLKCRPALRRAFRSSDLDWTEEDILTYTVRRGD